MATASLVLGWALCLANIILGAFSSSPKEKEL